MIQRKGSAGFTLIEVLIVVLIITILVGIVGVNIFDKPGEARNAAAKLQIRNLQTALQVYRTQQGRLPSQAQGLEALVKKPVSDPIPRNYPESGYLEQRSVPSDPWGNPYIYLVPGRNNEAFEIISYGADGEPGGQGEDADVSSSGEM